MRGLSSDIITFVKVLDTIPEKETNSLPCQSAMCCVTVFYFFDLFLFRFMAFASAVRLAFYRLSVVHLTTLEQ